MSDNWLIRATTKTGVQFVTDFCKTEAILIFKIFHDAAKEGVYPEDAIGIPATWRTEVFKSFMLDHGDIVLFELVERLAPPDGSLIVYNSMWIERDVEGRFQVKTTVPAKLVYTFTGLRPGRTAEEWIAVPVKVIDGNFGHYHPQADDEIKVAEPSFWMDPAVIEHEEMHLTVLKNRLKDRVEPDHEMSADWHMGFYEEQDPENHVPLMRVLKSRVSEDEEKIIIGGGIPRIDLAPNLPAAPDQKLIIEEKFDGASRLNLARWDTKDNDLPVLRTFEDHLRAAGEIVAAAAKADKTSGVIMVSGDAQSHTIKDPIADQWGKAAEAVYEHERMHEVVKDDNETTDMYTADAELPRYQIYVNGVPWPITTDDISFMPHIRNYMEMIRRTGEKIVLSHAICQSLEMHGDLYSLLVDFYTDRSFTIGANLLDQPLKEGQAPEYLLSWSDYPDEVLFSDRMGYPGQDEIFSFDDVNL